MNATLDTPTALHAEECAALDSLQPFFRPRAIAVVGASRRPGSIGARLLETMIRCGFHGKLYPVNPHAQSVADLPAYRSVRDIPAEVDLAVIAVPPEAILEVVDDCATRAVPALLVITAGFAETGTAGAALQQALLDRARSAHMRLIGPNCLGLINTDPAVSLNATFVPVFPPRGPVAVSSDSGALGLGLVAMAAQRGLGISSCVTVGNRADVSCADLLEYWEKDEATSLIVLYLESFGEPGRFAQVARRVSRHKPIVALKAGKTRAGSRSAHSHTAALAARDSAVDAVFRQTGIIRVDTLEDLLDLAAAMSMQPLPRSPRVAVLTNAGGPAILCADSCEAGGLVLPELSARTRQELAAFLPRAASLGNPVDMIASATAEQYHRAITVLLGCGEVDGLIVLYVCPDAALAPAVQDAIATAAHQSAQQRDRLPVLACLMGVPVSPAWLAAGPEHIPCHAFPEEPGRALARMASWAEWRRQGPGRMIAFPDMHLGCARAICRTPPPDGDGWLTTEAVRELLRSAGLKVAPGGVARTADDAVALAWRVGFPVAVKLASHRILHKTERGCVHLNVANETGVRSAFEAIRERLASEQAEDSMEGVLIQPMLSAATEVLIGVTGDPLFGRLVGFGLGGIHVEVLGDVCFRVVPLSDRDAREMVRSIRGARLLLGHRGQPPADLAALEEMLQRLSRLVESVPEIVEIDLNPVFARRPGQGCLIADARVRVAGPGN
jgi:acyl-CoA synthetase (NDP forming)